jgi:hypothetical protein
MDEQISRIKRKLAAKNHSLGPVLTESEIAAFEARHRVRLPECYRRFLLEVGNGGYGPPQTGIARLGEPPVEMTEEERRPWVDFEVLACDFPFTESWCWEDEPDMWDAAGRDWSSEAKAKLARIERGNLCLGGDGCGQSWHLIVTGPERGNVWFFADVGITPTVPKRDFLRWYEDWLNGVKNWWA